MTLELIENKQRRRDKLIIMMDIVAIAEKGTSKTHIMSKANLSFSQLKEYIGFLVQHHLLERISTKGRTVYKTTHRGIEFMERQEQVICMFNENSPKTLKYSRDPQGKEVSVYCVKSRNLPTIY